MALFRKRPVVISAVQWTGDLGCVPPGVCVSLRGGCFAEPHIHTLEGMMVVGFGDWVITDVSGEVYPCKPSIFEMTYEAVDER